MAAYQEVRDLLSFKIVALGAGADPDGRDHDGNPALVLSILELAWRNMRALLANGADINQVAANGDSPVLTAAYLDEWEQVGYLIEHGADYTWSGSNGVTVAYLVSSFGSGRGDQREKWALQVRGMLEQRGVRFPVDLPTRRSEH